MSQSSHTTVNTKPTRPRPPQNEIEAVQAILPRVLGDMDNVTGYGATDPGEGQRIVTYGSLVKQLTEQRHGRAASEWAIHEFVLQQMLTARYGRLSSPAFFRDGQMFGGGEYETKELEYCLIQSTPALWEWRQSSRERETDRGPPALPVGKESAQPPHAATIVSLGNRQYRVSESAPIVVTENEDTVLQAFLENTAMDEGTLIRTAGFDRAARVLRELKKKHSELAPAIRLPAKKGVGGYHVSISRAPKAPE